MDVTIYPEAGSAYGPGYVTGFIIHIFFFFSSRRRHTRSDRDWSSDVCSSDLAVGSTTQSILPWAWNSTASSFTTYGTDGLRPLVTSEYETALDAPSGPTANIRKIGRASCRERV